MSVGPQQRFSKAHPCPICGGYDQLARGAGARCYGFLSAGGRYAHCTREDFAGVLERNAVSQTFAHRLEGPCDCGHTHRTSRSDATGKSEARRPVSTWTYYSADGGTKLYEIDRSEIPDGKTYGVRRPAPKDWRACQHHEQCRQDKVRCAGGWISTLRERPCSPRVEPVLYNQTLLDMDELSGEPVHNPEGEGCTDALRSLGLIAVTNPFGAGKWHPKFSEKLAGRSAAIHADADEPGRRFAEQKARSLWGPDQSALPIAPAAGGQ